VPPWGRGVIGIGAMSVAIDFITYLTTNIIAYKSPEHLYILFFIIWHYIFYEVASIVPVIGLKRLSKGMVRAYVLSLKLLI
jgi:hypothetical protein